MDAKIINNVLYRFRRIDNLLGEHQELENQSIFFAPPEILNDPMEGFRDIVFNGDVVLWRNLFKHYLLCLFGFACDCYCFGEGGKSDAKIEILSLESSIPKEYKEPWNRLSKAFLDDKIIADIIRNIVTHRKNINKIELGFYLSTIHPIAIKYVLSEFKHIGVIDTNPYIDINSEQIGFLNNNFFESLNEMLKQKKEHRVDDLFLQHQSHAQQLYLALAHNKKAHHSNQKMLYNGFPFAYVQSVEKLMYPNWFTACFMSCATNSSVWGNYGHNHTGVCLIFDAEFSNNQHSLTLNNAVVGWSMAGAIHGPVNLPFYEIRYTHQREPLNFFDSLGRLPMFAVHEQWWVDSNGAQSKNTIDFNDEWRERYWKNFYEAITQKSDDWKYENEYRLILSDMSFKYKDSGIVLNYDFKSLQGVIFGINTSDEHKLKIIDIIERKIRQYKHYDFKFYQAYYCRHSGTIKHTELGILKFSQTEEVCAPPV